jgi:Leucine-rich repeat (LRR) protein
MNKPLPLVRSIPVLIAILFCAMSSFAQEDQPASPDTAQIDNYKEQIKRLVGFLEFSLNTLGDPETSVKEKEVIINESFLKAFLNDEVQIEDDLDENREVVTHKDVQAYLKDVDFFFQHVSFDFDIQDILPQTTDEGMLYFKVTANRQLQGVTVEEEEVNNTSVRYIEINLDEEEQVLKIASIYTTRINEREELMAWWNRMPSAWKEILGGNLMIGDSLLLKDVEFLSDTTLGVIDQLPIINEIDTMLEIGGRMVQIQGFDTLYRAEYDTIPVDSTTAFKALMSFPAMEHLDISGNLYIRDLEPVEQLTGLKTLVLSFTLAGDLFPLRNLTRLEELDVSGTPVTDISPLKYNIKISKLFINGTNVSSLQALDNLQALETLHMSNTLVDSIQPIRHLPLLKDIRFDHSSISDLSPLAELTRLEILDISGTPVTSLEPLEFITSLKIIYLKNTEITNIKALSRLDNLQVINLDGTLVSDLEPLKELPSLQKIYCDQSGVMKSTANQFMLDRPGVIVIYESEALSKWWSQMANDWKAVFRKLSPLGSPPTVEQLHELTLVTSLDISGNIAITDLDPLAKLTNLREIRCPETSITSIDPLKELIDLTYLDCSSTRVRDLNPLQSLVHLKELNISETLVTSLEGLEGISDLEVLYLDNTQVDNLDPLNGNSGLRTIYCDETRVGKADVDRFQESNPGCLVIYETPILIEWWTGLSPSWQKVFQSNLPLDDPPSREQLHALVRLNILDASGFEEVNSLEPLKIFYNLQKLDLSNTMVSDISPLTTMVTIQELNLSGNPLSDLSPVSKLTRLTSLDISNTPVEKLDPVESLEDLEYLNCSGTPVKKLNPIETLFQLRTLEINNTNIKNINPLESLVALRQLKCFNTSISSRNIEKFKESNPQVDVVYY